jgi:hypothetical protein
MKLATMTLLLVMSAKPATKEQPPSPEKALLALLGHLDTPTRGTGCAGAPADEQTLRDYVSQLLVDNAGRPVQVRLTCKPDQIDNEGKVEDAWRCVLGARVAASEPASLNFWLRRSDLLFYRHKLVCLP